jgi:large subunit ribosomal protein L18
VRPRLCVRRSLKHIYAQIIEDDSSRSLIQVSSLSKNIQNSAESKNKTEKARLVGRLIGETAKEKGIKEVVFDRGGYLYHGRVKALAEAARETGLKF